MKKSFHLALSALLVGIVACQKQNAEPAPAVDSKAAARQIFEQQRPLLPQTKLGNAQDLVKPLPGDFTPLWDQAVELTNAGQTSVTVPITSSVSYNAVYPCQNHDADHHDHHPILVIQKLVVITSADNPKCYIANTIPCQEGDGELTGFIAYHNFDGTLSHIDQFDNGTKVATAQKDDQKLIGEITRAVKLYPNISDNGVNRVYEKLDWSCANNIVVKRSIEYPSFTPCVFCGINDCTTAHTLRDHCPICRQVDYLCLCLDASAEGLIRCSWCRLYINYPVDSRACKCVDWRKVRLPKCSVCNSLNCYMTHNNNSTARNCPACGGSETCSLRPYTNSKHMVHADVIKTLFQPILSNVDLHSFQDGCQYVDNFRFSEGDEYKHALTYKFYSEDVKVEYEKLKSYFVLKIRSFLSSNSYTTLGEALHPLFDCYITVEERVEYSIPYFVYFPPQSLINEQYLLPYSHQFSHVSNIVLLYNYIINLNSAATTQQIGQLFEAWRISHSAKYN